MQAKQKSVQIETQLEPVDESTVMLAGETCRFVSLSTNFGECSGNTFNKALKVYIDHEEKVT